MSVFDALHFLRPQWLWALLLLPAVPLIAIWRQRRRVQWQVAIDPHLLVHLLEGGGRRGNGGWLLLLVGLLLAVLALAGPSWRQIEQPLWETKTPLVIVLDLSSRSAATDLPPSRLLQARAKLTALLRERKGGEVALVVYAADPFTVAPLTADASNVALFLDALAPDIMPADGQRADKALEWAAGLLRQAGARDGDILLLSDHADAAASAQALRIRGMGHHVSALGLGTPQGAAYRSTEGRIEQARLDEASLRALAAAGGGSYARITADDADLQALGVLQARTGNDGRSDETSGRSWQDEGYWLLPPLLLLALLAFRRPMRGMATLLLCLSLPLALPVHAAESSWWQRDDQRIHQRMTEGAAAYRKGDFAAAQRSFEGVDSAEGHYNLGNALARQGRYDDAIAAYDRALKVQPGMEDARVNRAAVEAARKRQQSQEDKPGNKQQNAPNAPQPGKDSPGQQGQSDATQQQGAQDKPQASDTQGKNKEGQPPSSSDGKSQARDDKPRTEDAGKQQQADQAQRQRMADAMRQQQARDGGDQRDVRAVQAAMSPQEREQRQAVEAWMQRVPDEPGALLKAKFQLENERRKREGR